MKKWLYNKCLILCVLTSILYLITICTVSYVGVYLTYIALPIIILSGFIACITHPKNLDEINSFEKFIDVGMETSTDHIEKYKTKKNKTLEEYKSNILSYDEALTRIKLLNEMILEEEKEISLLVESKKYK